MSSKSYLTDRFENLKRLIVEDRSYIEIFLINLIFLFYLFRTSIPAFKFPFVFIYAVYLIYFIFNYKRSIFSNEYFFKGNYLLVLLSAVILLISFLTSSKIYLTIFKDVTNTGILISIFLMATIIVSGKKKLEFYIGNLVYLTVLFALIISIKQLADLFYIFPSNNISTITDNEILSSADTSFIDYNFALIPSILGIIGSLYFLQFSHSRLRIFFFNLLLFIFSFNILLSGSRRGIILLGAFFITFLLAKLNLLFRNDGFLKRLSSKSGIFLGIIVFLVIVVNLFLFHSTSQFKNQALVSIGSKNTVLARYDLSKKIFRYISVIDKKTTFSELLWTVSFDPNDPDSGWGYRIHKTVFPLTGTNAEIVPKFAKGYLLDNTCVPNFYSQSGIFESYTLFLALNTSKGERYRASIYCYVSDNFDGNTVSFGNTYSSVDNGIVKGNPYAYYDLKSKGQWKKLEVEFDCNDGVVPIVLSFTKTGVKDFSQMTGSVIFAYPQCFKVNIDDNRLIPVIKDISESWNNHKTGINGLNIQLTLPHKASPDFNGHNFEVSKEADGSQFSSQLSSGYKRIKYSSAGIISMPFPGSIFSAIYQDEPDPIRKLASKLISEDTTYYPYKAKIIIKPISNSFIGDRILRWEFAGLIFNKEYNWKQKLFGGGFNFLNWYGYYFLNDKTKSDWPHNPFLAVLLYSGICGLLIYCVLIFMVFYYYLKYVKQYPILFIFFLIVFFFSFFSGSSPFDPPIMGFFVILPFFIHSIHKKEKKSPDLTISE